MRFLATIAFVFAAIGCKKAPPEAAENDTERRPTSPADAAAVAMTPDSGPAIDCSKHMAPLRSKVDRAYVAKETVQPYEDAIELWPGVDEACRNGEWYVLAAKLIAWGRKGTKLEADGVVIETRDQALAAAVTHPLRADDLEYVAMAAAAAGTTKLPADACQVAELEIAGKAAGAALREAADAARYICGHAALAANDPAEAKARFEAIEDTGFYPDLPLRLAEAELALGNEREARKLAKVAAALDELEASWRFVSTDDWKAIVAAAKAIAK